MRIRLVLGSLLVAALIAACQGPPPTVIYIVISPTPNTTEAPASTATVLPASTEVPTLAIQAAATTEVAVASVPTLSVTTAVPTATTIPSNTLVPTNTATSAPTNTPIPPTIGPTALPPNFPTPTIAKVQVAEELFDHGRMFWVQPIDQIWVLMITGTGHGTWSVYQDTWKDGDPENDPSLVPPAGRYQPQRGFGKLWRETPGLRDALGWGVTPEFGYVSNYEYHAGGSIDATGNYVKGPGYHILFSLDGELFRFNEADGTWQLGNN